MMKKISVLLVVIVLLAAAVVPAFAYTGVSGAVYDAYGQPWTHGGTVYVVGTTANGGPGTLIGGVGTALSGTGTFTVDWSSLPANDQPTSGTNVTIVIVFNNGGLGTPQTQQFTDQFTQFSFIPGTYSLGNIDTGTGPTAVTLSGISTNTASALPLVAGLAALFLAGVSFVAIRRRQAA